ncbi:hypothetical protein [Brevibacterium oceani]|uniref:hypothetical protein n=1 Tax=Brevibacterium oceani TaxID=358099 RepID=UPI0015E6E6E3|nr:hypothetical protein [Brevibacterium oceani]
MITIAPVQSGRHLEITLNRDVLEDEQALDAVLKSLGKSRYESHRAIAAQIEAQLASPLPLIRFSLNPSAAARIENSLRFRLEARGKYRDWGQVDLHQKLCRVLGMHRPSVFA